MQTDPSSRVAWAPFFVSILAYLAVAIIATYLVIAQRLNLVAQYVDFQGCRDLLQSQGELAMRICAQNQVAWFMSDPHHLARFFIIVFIPALLLGLVLTKWGLRKNNKAMWFTGFITAAVLFTQDRTMFIPAIAVIAGHSLAMLWSSRQRR